MRLRTLLVGAAGVAIAATAVGVTLDLSSRPLDDKREPESIAADSGPGGLYRLDTNMAGKAAARWVDRGETIAILTYGSSSCPPVPVDVDTDDSSQRITVTISDAYEGPCTADLAPYTSLVRLRDPVDPSGRFHLVIRREPEKDVTLPL